MGFMDEKFDPKKENAQKEQIAAINTAVTTAVAKAIVKANEPLHREINNLKDEIKDLKKISVRPTKTVIDDDTRTEIKGIITSAAAGIDSYRYPIYMLFGGLVILTIFTAWTSHKIDETTYRTEWRYDIITGILSGDRNYWWDGENYQASQKAPEAKRLKEAVERYQKISEQMKQAGK